MAALTDDAVVPGSGGEADQQAPPQAVEPDAFGYQDLQFEKPKDVDDLYCVVGHFDGFAAIPQGEPLTLCFDKEEVRLYSGKKAEGCYVIMRKVSDDEVTFLDDGAFRELLEPLCHWQAGWEPLLPWAIRALVHLYLLRKLTIFPSEWWMWIWDVEKLISPQDIRVLLFGADPPNYASTDSGIAFHVPSAWTWEPHEHLAWVTGVNWTGDYPKLRLQEKGIVPVNLYRTIVKGLPSLEDKRMRDCWEPYTAEFLKLVLQRSPDAAVYLFKNPDFPPKPIHDQVKQIYYRERGEQMVVLTHPASHSSGRVLPADRKKLNELCGPSPPLGKAKSYSCSKCTTAQSLYKMERICGQTVWRSKCTIGRCSSCATGLTDEDWFCPQHDFFYCTYERRSYGQDKISKCTHLLCDTYCCDCPKRRISLVSCQTCKQKFCKGHARGCAECDRWHCKRCNSSPPLFDCGIPECHHEYCANHKHSCCEENCSFLAGGLCRDHSHTCSGCLPDAKAYCPRHSWKCSVCEKHYCTLHPDSKCKKCEQVYCKSESKKHRCPRSKGK